MSPTCLAMLLAGGIEMQSVTPRHTDEVLFNPGMGLYLQAGPRLGLKPEPDEWFMKVCDIAYYRLDWSVLQPGEDRFAFDEYFGPIFDFWVKRRGKRVAFRVMCENMHSRGKYVTPEWVFEAGVPGVSHRGLYAEEQIDPVFWDERYLAVHERFIRALGGYLDGRDGLEFIDIGSIGEWGEMHLGMHHPGRWTREQLEETGYTEAKYVAAYRRIIDAFARAFPASRVFLNVGSYGNVNDYAALRGMHFRQDGLTPSGPSANVGKEFYHPYARRGVICNYEFHSSYDSMKKKGWDLEATVEKGLEDPISYLNTNVLGLWGMRKAPREARDILTSAARRIGFRFVLTECEAPKRFRLDGERAGRLVLKHAWENMGVAPCYESYAVRFELVDSSGKTAATQLHFPKTPTTLWWPAERVREQTLMRIPARTRPGKYSLRVSMLLPEKPGKRILLGIEGRDEKDRYGLCDVEGVRSEAVRRMVHEEGFEPGSTPWRAAGGVSARVDPSVRHGGRASMSLEGTQEGSWNYAALALDEPVLPGSLYRLSCWMRVDEIAPATWAPYLKLGLSDEDGRWIANRNTSRYDLARLGTWQELEATFETAADTAGGHLAVEKGARGPAVRIVLWLDDVRLEVLESP